MTLAEALDRLSDPRAAAGQRPVRPRRRAGPGPSLMLDDGEIERRVRLIRPMEHAPFRWHDDETHWEEADRDTFARPGRPSSPRCRSSRTARSTSSRAAVADLEAAAEQVDRVYRLQTDAGERIIGRRVSPAWVANAVTSGP